MIPSISMWSLDREVLSSGLGQADFIHWSGEQGLGSVELLSYYMEREENASEIARILDKMEMTLSCYTILTDFTLPYQDLRDELIRDLDTARNLGSPFVRILGGDGKDPKARTEMIDGIRRACTEAEMRGRTLILENIGPHSGDARQILELIREVDHPSLKVNFDTANPLLADEDPMEALKLLLPHIAYVHLKDFIRESHPGFSAAAERDPARTQSSRQGVKMTGVAAGKGELPLAELIGLLKEGGYKGFVSVEYEGTGDARADTRDSLFYLRQLLD